ncbi:MAG: polyribonucleotide nucleotidyltransferase [Armatimonadetes bacterium]|nr:polyribonucleotide nucleotidyltransferase [Armatimonadota bacterium]
MIEQVELDLDGRTLRIETGRVAKQADGAVLVSMGDTIVLACATMGDEPRQGIDFFPLVCDYEERKYAVGKIPGGFVKRGGRPSERAILVSRLIDRPLRPLFPDGMRNEVQVIAIPLSVELANPPDMLAMVAASAALSISRIPFNGPIGAVRVARIEGAFVINPSWEQVASADLNLVIAGTRDAVTTVEAEADQVDESVVLEAIHYGHEYIQKLIDLQDQLVRKVGKPNAEVVFHNVPDEIIQAVRDQAGKDIRQAIQGPDKAQREEGIEIVKAEIVGRMIEGFPEQEIEIGEAVEKVVKEEVRRLILQDKVRPDGRKPDEIRQISCEVGFLPRVHGSGLFTRGETQVLTTVVLGSLDDSQIVDTVEEDSRKRYMHFYNFPPFSVGETRPLRGPGRRDIGHGALAEKALASVIPPQEELPYTILLTSEVLESSGSTSMASTCGCTLALMDAGIKIKAPIAGAAMGLMTDGERYVVLSDILDMEDFSGDMDFKIAGSADGITAIQMDTKIHGIPKEILKRPDMSPYAPRVFIIEIHPDKIGDVIGPGGKVIKKIEADTGASISIEQDGHVYITAVDKDAGERALKMVEDITRDVQIGETYVGRVTKTAAFGAFVEILPGREGLIHISQLAPYRVERVEDVVKVGDELLVKVIEVSPKIALTRKGCVEPGEGQAATDERREDREPRDQRDRDRRDQRGPRDRPDQSNDDLPQPRFRPKR